MATFDDIVSNIQAAIPELDSTSKTSFIQLVAAALSVTIDNTLSEQINSQNVISDIIGKQRYGRSGYYTKKALAYQDGDNLIPDPITLYPIYETIDETKKIIKQAAFDPDLFVLKVAYINPETGELDALPSDKKAAFDNYFLQFEIPRLPVTKLSNSPDILNFDPSFTYYGNYSLTDIKTGVAAALIDFKENFEFNGILFINDAEDYLKQNVPGLRNVTLSNCVITDPVQGVIAFTSKTVLPSGYFKFDSSISVKVDNSSNYVPI